MTLEEIYEKNKQVQGSLLKFKADRRPVALSLGLLALQLLAFYYLPHGAAAVAGFLFLFPLGSCAIYNHHQQHHNAFNSRALNRLFEVVLGLQTAIPSYGWVAHHNYGHHPNYMNQPPCGPGENEDESRWARRNGELMGRNEYVLNLLFRSPFDSIGVMRKRPMLAVYLVLMFIPLIAVHALLASVNWINWLAVFVLPSFCMLIYVYWLTYEHHSGLWTKNHYQASRNRVGRLYNLRTFNLGYHTAHHIKPFLHWSLLPEYHKLIEKEIPPECFVECQ